MYDNLKIRLKRNSSHNVDWFSELSYNLSNVKTRTSTRTKLPYVFGYIKNLFVLINSNYLFISGSLTKFKFGHNVFNLTTKETKEAIDELNALFPIDIKDAIIYKVEIGFNIVLNQSVTNYLKHVCSYKRSNKKEISSKSEHDIIESVYFFLTCRIVKFYDKNAELIHKRQSCPVDLPNILRCEISFTGSLKRYFKKEYIYLGELDQTETWNMFRNAYLKELRKVNFNRMIKADVKTDSLNEYKSLLLLKDLKNASYNMNESLESLLESKFSRKLDQETSRMRSNVTKLIYNNKYTKSPKNVIELKSKIENQTLNSDIDYVRLLNPKDH